jgi:hypothetical protein
MPPKFYFYLLPQGRVANATRYQHPAIVLGEGFASLGISFASNVDQWPPSPGAIPLFRADPAIDSYSCSGFPKFDIVLRSHFGASTPYPPTFHPWAFGLSNRIIDGTASQPLDVRVRRLLVSYRHTRHPHAIRLYMQRNLLDRLTGPLTAYQYEEHSRGASEGPLAEHLWRLTGRRHSDRYYSVLRQSTASACFGGYFLTNFPRDERHVLSRFMKRAITRLHLRTRRITQFDSWRFWESLAAGCATVHLDLDRYGARLPVMPRNWEHYIGLDLDRLDDDIERMVGDPTLIDRIGAAGRLWSLATYGPRPTALRFLALIGLPAHTVI